MNNKLLKAALLSSVVLASFVATSTKAEEFEGLYGGVEAGFKDTTSSGYDFVIGGVLGYRQAISQDSPIVIGIEADYGFYTEEDDSRYGISPIIGYKLNDSSLLYAKVGYSRYEDLADTHSGFSVGGGYEQKLSQRLSLRLDYKFMDYDDDLPVQGGNLYQGHEVTTALIFGF
jgi:opacity protein-like surface antigen